MLKKILALLKINDFVKDTTPKTKQNNARLGIHSSFSKDKFYIEVHKEDYYYAVFLFGGIFMNGYYPTRIDIVDEEYLRKLETKLKL